MSDDPYKLIPGQNGSVTALDYLQSIYRNSNEPTSTRMRAATVAIQFESPKLAAVSYLNGADDFADRLDRAIQYMESRMKLVEHRPLPDNPDNDQE